MSYKSRFISNCSTKIKKHKRYQDEWMELHDYFDRSKVVYISIWISFNPKTTVTLYIELDDVN